MMRGTFSRDLREVGEPVMSSSGGKVSHMEEKGKGRKVGRARPVQLEREGRWQV